MSALRRRRFVIVTLAALLAGGVAAGCSGASSSPSAPDGPGTGTVADASSSSFVPASGTAQNGEIFPRYTSKAGGYSFAYPGGWRIKQTGSDVRIARFGNAVAAVVRKRATKPYYKGYQKQLKAQLKKGDAKVLSAIVQPAQLITFDNNTKATMAVIEQHPSGRPAVVTYRYLFWKNGRILILSCSSPKGVDNGDAYDLIASTVTLH